MVTKQNNQIKTDEQLNIVLNAVKDYYKFNACTTKARIDNKPVKETCLTVSQLLLGAVGVATSELQDFKSKVSQ